MKSHNKTINKHTRTRSENNASIKNYFQSASSKVIDHTTYSQTYLKSLNKNSSLLSMNVSSEIKNPLPAINVLQPNDSEPLVQSQLQPLPDTAISRKRSRSPDPPPSSPILASKRRPIGHCSPGTAEGPSGQGWSVTTLTAPGGIPSLSSFIKRFIATVRGRLLLFIILLFNSQK